MIYWDLDEVLRLLADAIPILDKKRGTWDKPLIGGQDLTTYINHNLHILKDAKPSRYLTVALFYDKIPILSHQPELWQKPTTEWVKRYLPNADLNFVGSALEKLEYLEPGDYLIDDYPKFYFTEYSRIILVNSRYNQDVSAPMRVYNEAELLDILDEIG
jgi:hypothetical protein